MTFRLAALLLVPQLNQIIAHQPSHPLDPYLALLFEYRRGDFDTAARELWSWPESRIREMVLHIEYVKQKGKFHRDEIEHLRARTTDPYIQAAVLMHTDAALLTRGYPADPSPEYHLGVAEHMLRFIEDASRLRSFERNWRVAMGYYFQTMLLSERALEYFQKALDVARDDPEILLAVGTVREDLGWRLRRNAPSSWTPLSRRTASLTRDREYLQKTADYFVRALRVSPDLIEARLRLGRVEHLLGNKEKAVKELRACAEAARDPTMRLLSHLFLGQALEEQGQISEAIRAYQIAVETQPHSQAASLALSYALHLRGDRAAARERLERALLDRPYHPIDPDPWWRYPFGRSDRFRSMLQRMREEITF